MARGGAPAALVRLKWAPVFAVAIFSVVAGALTVGPILAAPDKAGFQCPSGSSKHPSIGRGRAPSGSVLVNGARRKQASLFSGNVVCTNGTPFSFQIRVGGEHASCVETPKSALRLHPSSFLLRFIYGLSTCDAGGRTPKRFRGAQDTKIVAEDPVFSVLVDRRQTVVRVLSGSTLVSGVTGSAGAVVVGPKQAVHVPNGDDPRAPVGIRLTASELSLNAKLAQNEPKPDFGRPDATGSPALKRIYAKGTIVVGIDGSVINQPPYEFTKTYFYFLGKQWGLDVSFQTFSPKTALKDLKAGTLDLIVSSTDVLGGDAVPLFGDAKKHTWSMVVYPDKAYEEALRRFLVAMVNSGTYAAQYRSAFNDAPSYEPLQAALFPK